MEELSEALKKNDKEKLEEEAGDLLFMAINLVRFLGVNPELALSKANEKFERRFRYMEERAKEMGKKLEDMSIEEMELLWQEAKEKML